jgi:hypothetical protein
VAFKVCAVVATLLTAGLLAPSAARAERVGYQFCGTLHTTTAEVILFGHTVKDGANVSGSFAYDLTSAGVDVEPGSRRFTQYIAGGFVVNIDDGTTQLHITSDEYRVTVSNDYTSSTTPLTDLVSISYSNFTKPPPPLKVNGVPWDNGRLASMAIHLFWPHETFGGPDEPKLAAGRPIVPTSTVEALIGSSSPPSTGVSLQRIEIPTTSGVYDFANLPGDYNYDGRVDGNDFAEWRGVFGSTSPASMYADGNHNGVVDAADYVVWRRSAALGSGSSMSVLGNVPEPALGLLWPWAVVGSACFRSRAR